jgi:streptogramin lyase
VPIGPYTITADSVVTADTIVGSRTDTATVTGASMAVVKNDTTKASAAYAFKDRHGAMWVANNSDAAIYEFAPESLRASGAPTPEDSLGAPTGPTGMVLDANGNLWVVADASDTIKMFTPAQRVAGGTPAGMRILTDTAIHNALSAAMDHAGNLWVSTRGQLRAYAPAQLSAGGVQSAAIVVRDSLFAETVGMVFDSAGNAWVAHCFGDDLLRFTAAQLAAGGWQAPVDTLSADSASASLVCPTGIAYDRKGNLWVLNYFGSSISSFAPSQLTASGKPVPQVKVTLPTSSTPWGLAFDQHGALWVGDFAHNVVDVFSPAQLAVGGAVAPADTIAGPGGTSTGATFIVFDPAAPDPIGSGAMARTRGRISRPSVARARTVALPADVGIHPRETGR